MLEDLLIIIENVESHRTTSRNLVLKPAEAADRGQRYQKVCHFTTLDLAQKLVGVYDQVQVTCSGLWHRRFRCTGVWLCKEV